MSRWEKLINNILNMSGNMRFQELKRVLEAYGYVMQGTKGGSSHFTFRKPGKNPITIPAHEPIKKIYVEMVRNVVLEEGEDDEEDENEKD